MAHAVHLDSISATASSTACFAQNGRPPYTASIGKTCPHAVHGANSARPLGILKSSTRPDKSSRTTDSEPHPEHLGPADPNTVMTRCALEVLTGVTPWIEWHDVQKLTVDTPLRWICAERTAGSAVLTRTESDRATMYSSICSS